MSKEWPIEIKTTSGKCCYKTKTGQCKLNNRANCIKSLCKIASAEIPNEYFMRDENND